MAESRLALIIETKGGGKLRRFEKGLKDSTKTADKLQGELKDAFGRKSLSGIDAGTKGLDRFEKEAKQAEKAVRKLGRAARGIQSVNATASGGGGGGGGGFGAGAALGLAAGGGADKQNAAIAKGNQLLAQRQQIENGLLGINNEIAASLDDIAASTTAIKIQEGQVKRLTNRNAELRKKNGKLTESQVKELINAKELVKQTNKALQQQERLKQKLVGQQTRLNRQLKSTKRIEGVNNARIAKSQRGGLGNALSGPLGKFAAAAAALVTATTALNQFSAAIQKASEVSSAEQRIRALSEGYDDYGSVLGTVTLHTREIQSQPAGSQQQRGQALWPPASAWSDPGRN